MDRDTALAFFFAVFWSVAISGMKLLRVCHSKLDVAAQRIEIVTQISGDGEVQTAEFDSTATLQKTPATGRTSRKVAMDDDDDDALLF